MDVVFEVASQQYPLDEQAATLMAENLRVKAAHEPGAEGTVGALLRRQTAARRAAPPEELGQPAPSRSRPSPSAGEIAVSDSST